MNVLPFPFLLRKEGERMKVGKVETQNENESRNEEPQKRSIILPAWLWDKLTTDARRCKRSTNKQLEALLAICYDPEADIEINKEALASAFDAVSHKRLRKAG